MIRAVEDNDLKAEGTAQIFSRLSFTGTGRSSRGTTHGQVQRLGEGNVAPVSEGRDDESTGVADVLIVVPSLPIANGGHDLLLVVLGVSLGHTELKLRSPGEVTLLNDSLIAELLDDISGVHINGNDGDDLDTDLHGEVASDTANELGDTVSDQGKELLHG